MADRSIPEWIRKIIGEAARDPATMRRNAQRVGSGFVSKLRRVVRTIPFAEDLLAAYYCALDSRTPLKVRATLMGALGYFVMPFDTLPDFILGLGFTDDATVLIAALSLVASHIKPEHREAARRALDDDLDVVDLDPSDFQFRDSPSGT
ncbi:YkvA family protein [Tepidamorphus sp. 3E244]|uniref:YkvA family protein n=1 Tax=Tepidamorphus sp. 3E244 TaxID=3385498 RepID=UPI0038FC902E